MKLILGIAFEAMVTGTFRDGYTIETKRCLVTLREDDDRNVRVHSIVEVEGDQCRPKNN